MPVSHHIDTQSECIYVTIEGPVTDHDLIEGQQLMFRDPLFDGRYCRLIDTSAVTSFQAGAETVRRIARAAVERGVRKVAIVAVSDLVYAMFRMYEAYAAEAECRVFRDRDEALAWLNRRGLQPDSCRKQQELRQAVTAVLERIDTLTRRQIEAMDRRDYDQLMALDRELEAAFGEKERAFGALKEHRTEHNC